MGRKKDLAASQVACILALKQAGVTQKDISKQLGIPKATVSKRLRTSECNQSNFAQDRENRFPGMIKYYGVYA